MFCALVLITTMNIKTQKETILKRLEDAGADGLAKSKLRISKRLEVAFQQLLKDREIGNLGSKTRTRLVLKKYFNPLKRAYDEIEKFTTTGKKTDELIPFTLTKIRNKLTAGSIREKTDEAVEFLVKEKRLLKIKLSRWSYFLHVSTLKPYLSFKEPVARRSNDLENVKIDLYEVVESYGKIKQQKGFSNIEIYELQQDLAVSMESLKSFLLQESQNGRAVLSLGDWSLSSEDTRSGAVYLDGKPYLLVRFIENV